MGAGSGRNTVSLEHEPTRRPLWRPPCRAAPGLLLGPCDAPRSEHHGRAIHGHAPGGLPVVGCERRAPPLEHPRVTAPDRALGLQLCALSQHQCEVAPSQSGPRWGERPRRGPVLGAATAGARQRTARRAVFDDGQRLHAAASAPRSAPAPSRRTPGAPARRSCKARVTPVLRALLRPRRSKVGT